MNTTDLPFDVADQSRLLRPEQPEMKAVAWMMAAMAVESLVMLAVAIWLVR